MWLELSDVHFHTCKYPYLAQKRLWYVTSILARPTGQWKDTRSYRCARTHLKMKGKDKKELEAKDDTAFWSAKDGRGSREISRENQSP